MVLGGKWGHNYTYILLISFQSVSLPLKASQFQTGESASGFSPSTCQTPGTNKYGLRYRSPLSNNAPNHRCHKTLMPAVSFVQCSPMRLNEKNSSSLILTLSFSLLVFHILILAPATCGHSRSGILGAVSRSFIIQSINNDLLIIYLLCTRHCSRAGNAETSKTIQLSTLMLHFNLMSRRGEVVVTISQAFQRRAERNIMLP